MAGCVWVAGWICVWLQAGIADRAHAESRPEEGGEGVSERRNELRGEEQVALRRLTVPLEGSMRSSGEIQLELDPSVQRQPHPVTIDTAGRQPVSDGWVRRSQGTARVDADRAPAAELLQRAPHREPHH